MIKEKKFYIMPRQTGKTKAAIAKLCENTNESLLLVINYDRVKNIKQKYDYKAQILDPNVNTYTYFLNKINSLREFKEIKTIIIDDYLSIPVYDRIDLTVQINNMPHIENVYIYSTPNILYCKELFNNICEYKKTNALTVDNCIKFRNAYSYVFHKQIDEMFFNFLTDSDTIIEKNTLLQDLKNENLTNTFSKEQFKTEIQGDFLETLNNLINLYNKIKIKYITFSNIEIEQL